MSSPTQAHPEHAPATAGAGGGLSPNTQGKRDVTCVGIDGIKMFEELRRFDPNCISNDDLSGISPGLAVAIKAFITETLDRFSTPTCKTQKVVVVFDGIFLPMSIAEAKLSEDLIMAASWIIMRLHHEVIFAPYLASSQLEILKQSQHIQGVMKPYPPRIPSELIEWNSSSEGPSQPNIYKYVPNLLVQTQFQVPSTILSMLEQPGPNTQDAQQKFIDRFSSVDQVGQNPVLFLLQLSGIISPKLARAIAHRLVESDGVKREDDDASALYEFMSVLLPLRAQIVHQLIADIETVPQTIQLKWDDQSVNTTPPLIQLDNWSISSAIQRGNGPNGAKHHSYIEPWGVTDVLRFETLAVSGKEDVDIFSVAPTVILRSLDLMGYFTHAQEEQDNSAPQPQAESSSCSIYGEALKQFASEPSLGEAATLFIELVRTNAFQIFRIGGSGGGGGDATATNSTVADAAAEKNGSSAEGEDKNKESSSSMQQESTSGDNKMDEQTNSSNNKEEKSGEQEAAGDSGDSAAADAEGDNNKACEDIGIKIACIVPCETILPADKCAHYDIAPHTQFIRGAQAHTRSLRMLMEASAGNVVLREFATASSRNSFSLQGMSDVLSTLPAALPFTVAPSSRAFYMFCAAKEFKTASAIAEHFGVDVQSVEKDLNSLKQFVTLASKACTCLSVRDEDVGLDPATIERVEPALQYIRASLGVAAAE